MKRCLLIVADMAMQIHMNESNLYQRGMKQMSMITMSGIYITSEQMMKMQVMIHNGIEKGRKNQNNGHHHETRVA